MLTNYDMMVVYPVIAEMTIQFLKPIASDVYYEKTTEVEYLEKIQNEAIEYGYEKFDGIHYLTDDKGEKVMTFHAKMQCRTFAPPKKKRKM